jgi:hypothetical protein
VYIFQTEEPIHIKLRAITKRIFSEFCKTPEMIIDWKLIYYSALEEIILDPKDYTIEHHLDRDVSKCIICERERTQIVKLKGNGLNSNQLTAASWNIKYKGIYGECEIEPNYRTFFTKWLSHSERVKDLSTLRMSGYTCILHEDKSYGHWHVNYVSTVIAANSQKTVLYHYVLSYCQRMVQAAKRGSYRNFSFMSELTIIDLLKFDDGEVVLMVGLIRYVKQTLFTSIISSIDVESFIWSLSKLTVDRMTKFEKLIYYCKRLDLTVKVVGNMNDGAESVEILSTYVPKMKLFIVTYVFDFVSNIKYYGMIKSSQSSFPNVEILDGQTPCDILYTKLVDMLGKGVTIDYVKGKMLYLDILDGVVVCIFKATLPGLTYKNIKYSDIEPISLKVLTIMDLKDNGKILASCPGKCICSHDSI